MGVKLNRKSNYANVASTKKKKMTYEDFYNKRGHCENDLIILWKRQWESNLLGNYLNVSIVQ